MVKLLLDEILKGEAQPVFAEDPPPTTRLLRTEPGLHYNYPYFFRKKWKCLHRATTFKLLPKFVILIHKRDINKTHG